MTTRPKIRRIPSLAELLASSERLASCEQIAAAVAVKHLLRAQPGLLEAATAPGSITIVVVPDRTWVKPVQLAWIAHLHRNPDADDEQTDTNEETHPLGEPDDHNGHHAKSAWFGFPRDGSHAAKYDDASDRHRLALAIHSNKPVYGWTHDTRNLPRGMLPLADRTVTIPPFTPEALADVLAALTGEPPNDPITIAMAKAVGVQDIALAWRPGETADGMLARLTRLRGKRTQAPRETDRLENLFGMDEAKHWGMGLVRDLPDYKAGLLNWHEVDHAVLIAGPPGCGKSTFARRLAASLNLPLVTGSPQTWQGSREGHLGHALAAMQATFQEARSSAPCVLFIDEVDSMGSRANFHDRNRDYSTAYMNGLLEQLDGMTSLDGVVVVAACNHPDRLDPALVRAGRLNRVLHISLPDPGALVNILRDRLAADLPDADLFQVVRHTLSATGADVEAWVRAARSLARQERRALTLADLIAQVTPAYENISPKTRERAAIHEAGHAVVAEVDRPGSVVRLSLTTGQTSHGYHRSLPEEFLLTRADVERVLRRIMGGRAAEGLLLGEPSSGAGGPPDSDLAKATGFAAKAIASWGLGKTPQHLLWRGEPTPENLRRIVAEQPTIAAEVHTMLAAAHDGALAILTKHRAGLVRVAHALLENGILERSEVTGLLTPSDPEELPVACEGISR